MDSSDHLADFSSVGPRMNDEALKPDLTAPGVDVLAARSQHIPWGEGYYQVDSGTSMAAPTSPAQPPCCSRSTRPGVPARSGRADEHQRPHPGYDAYRAGSGRLNVAAAYHQDQVIASGSVDAGLVGWGSAPSRSGGRSPTPTPRPARSRWISPSTPAPPRADVHGSRRARHGAGRWHLDRRRGGGPGWPFRRPVLRPGHGPLSGR
ncbi:S8 family serine peptidase [Micromonospora sp. M12]